MAKKLKKKEETNDSGVDLKNLLETAPPLPASFEELVEYPVGIFAGTDATTEEQYLTLEVKKYLPPLEENDPKKAVAYYRALYYLFAEDFPHPSELYKKMDIVLPTIELSNASSSNVTSSNINNHKQVNILIAIDASGSMAKEIDGKTMMNIAKDAVSKFIADIPENANVGLRAFGLEGTENDKSTLLHNIQPFNKDTLLKAVKDIQLHPNGWTPIARTLKAAKEDLALYSGDENINIVYLVSDGLETCGGDPVAAAKALSESDIKPIINVIGFNVDEDAQRQLKEIAEVGGGNYRDAGSEGELQDALANINKATKLQWEEWLENSKEEAKKLKDKQILEIGKVISSEYRSINRKQQKNIEIIIKSLWKDGYINSNCFYSISDDNLSFNNKIYDHYLNCDKRKDIFSEIINQNYEETIKELEESFLENVKNLN